MVFLDFDWLRIDNGFTLPREVGVRRTVVDSLEGLSLYVFDCVQQIRDCYVAVFSSRQIQLNLYDTIFLDVDNVENAGLVKEVIEREGLAYRSYFTGRGMHYYIDFEPTEMEREEYKRKVRYFVSHVLGIGNLVDMHVVGDVRRIARYPGTINTKTGTVMVAIRGELERNVGLGKRIKSLSIGSVNEVLLDVREHFLERVRSQELPACVDVLLNKMVLSGELEHVERLIVATYLLKLMRFEELVVLFSFLNDYDVGKTTYHLNWLLSRRYLPFSCRKVKDLGLCPKVCRFYPWMGREL